MLVAACEVCCGDVWVLKVVVEGGWGGGFTNRGPETPVGLP
jgi:hypothetical protein